MAFRRRRMQPRRRSFRPRGGGRWGDAGRKGGLVRFRREWTGFYENPGCGDLVEVTPNLTDECWAMEHNLVAPQGGQPAGDDTESTLLAFRGSVECWFQIAAFAGTFRDQGVVSAQVTGIGVGLQLVARREINAVVTDIPHAWDDCDNSDWLFRRWYPAVADGMAAIAGTIGTTSGTWMPAGDEQSRQIDITKRKVDWSEWALYITWAVPASEQADGAWLTRVNARLYESYVGGQSVIG